MPRTGTVPEDWDIQSSTTRKVALHGPPIVRTYPSSADRSRGRGRGRGGRGYRGAPLSGPSRYERSDIPPSPSSRPHWDTYDREHVEGSTSFRGRGRGRGGYVRAADTWRPPTGPTADQSRRYEEEELDRKARTYSPSLPVAIGIGPSVASPLLRPSPRPEPSASSNPRAPTSVHPSLSSLPPPLPSSLPTKPSWVTAPPSTIAERPIASSSSATSDSSDSSVVSVHMPTTSSTSTKAKRKDPPSNRSPSPISLPAKSDLVPPPPKMKFKPFNPNAAPKKAKEKGKEKDVSAHRIQAHDEEDELVDVKPVLEDVVEEAEDVGQKDSGVLAFSKDILPPACFSRNGAERDLARTSFRRAKFKLLKSEGKKPGTVIWRDDGMGINWTLLPTATNVNGSNTVSSPAKSMSTQPPAKGATGSGSTERPKKKSKKDAVLPSPGQRSSSALPNPSPPPPPSSKRKATAQSSGTKAKAAKSTASKHHLPTPPRTHTPPAERPPAPTSARMAELDKMMAKRINAIDNWTKLLKQYPSMSEKLLPQVERTQDEIFGLQEQITQEQMRIENGT